MQTHTIRFPQVRDVYTAPAGLTLLRNDGRVTGKIAVAPEGVPAYSLSDHKPILAHPFRGFLAACIHESPALK